MDMFGFPSVITGIRKLPFNKDDPHTLFIDINSCFATIEQQYNPGLRNKPVAVAAYIGPKGCIVAPSIEAKELNIKTGMLVKEAKKICPDIIIMEPDPPKYRAVHKKLKDLLLSYTPKTAPRSIDEFCIDIRKTANEKKGSIKIALEIKEDIRKKIGSRITVSIGAGPNEFLAKTASNLEKPDGFKIIDKDNFHRIFSEISLTDLCGIKEGNASRLARSGIFTVTDFYNSDVQTLRKAFGSIEGYCWHLRIRGWEMSQSSFGRNSGLKKTFGNSYAIPKNIWKKDELTPILFKLVEKTAVRLRNSGYKAKSFQINIYYRDGTRWKNKKHTLKYTDTTKEIYKIMLGLFLNCPYEKPVRILAETCFGLAKTDRRQLNLFTETVTEKNRILEETTDKINKKYGEILIKRAKVLGADNFADDRISFGKDEGFSND